MTVAVQADSCLQTLTRCQTPKKCQPGICQRAPVKCQLLRQALKLSGPIIWTPGWESAGTRTGRRPGDAGTEQLPLVHIKVVESFSSPPRQDISLAICRGDPDSSVNCGSPSNRELAGLDSLAPRTPPGHHSKHAQEKRR